MRPGLARRPQSSWSRGRQGERGSGDLLREGSTPPWEGSPASVGGSVVSSGKTKSSSGLIESASCGRFTILGSMSETEPAVLDVDGIIVSGVVVVVVVDEDVVGGEVVVEVTGRTGAMGSPTPANAAS